MNLKKWFVLVVAALALAACGDDSSTGGGSAGNDPDNPESSGSNDPSNPTSSDIEWVLPNDPSNLWKGAGTEESPYELNNEEDLLTLMDEVNSKSVNFKGTVFKLTADVSLLRPEQGFACRNRFA